MNPTPLRLPAADADPAGRIHPLHADPDVLRPFNEPTFAWRKAAERLESGLPRVRRAFRFAVNGAGFLGMAASAAGLFALADALIPEMSALGAGMAALLPSALVGLLCAHAAGTRALEWSTGFTPTERRLFAMRLGAGRAPARWPDWLSRWLFTGDWLSQPRPREKSPYLRAFVAGHPGDEREELAWWETILQQLDGRGGLDKKPWEAGATHYELGYTDSLPHWTRGIPDGSGLEEAVRRAGPATRTWATHFWRRATLRVDGLGHPDALEEGAFRFYRIRLDARRDALVVTLNPAAHAAAASDAAPAEIRKTA